MDNWIIISFVISALIILGLIIYFISKNKKNKKNKIIQEIELSTNNDKIKTVKNEVAAKKIVEIKSTGNIESESTPQQDIRKEKIVSNLSISSKTENDLLRKLEQFEKNNDFIKKDINLAVLSKQFKTNTKYLSEVIKTHRQKPFNTYLNELRINYIVNRLKNEPKYINTKVSYLASDCGFTSHSTFTTIFTQIMNESPSVFVKRIKEEQKK
ncbi:helix-turn-helix domain-containing protein [Empedobacter sp. 225-1]|uniref:helix-turn-helix domain-containing protein n=1 Tax=unclassified Empedobacter TaxID=2643773 RepID=UPI002578450A|nr:MULTISPECIES: helix-turn-helix domain-containing protein [unclassified Empedobacter]MDM1521686.1 helix-turn-helix domain-containing protein [Empedobacter sp. 225-1]MDM1541888.1 helix-turn-helix domain-containing protein [Empedobacter sp. 189-2]